MTQRKLITAFFIGMIGLSVASLSVSIAWYASSNYLRVSPVEISIKSEREIKISTSKDRESFKSELSLENGDLNYSGVFAPVSSIYSEDWISTRADTPVFYDCARQWSSYEEPVPNVIDNGYSYYYSQELYLWADDDVYLTIDTEQTYIKSNQLANEQFASSILAEAQKKDPNMAVDKIVEKLNLLTKAMRYSILVTGEDFYDYYVIDPNKAENDEEVLFGGVLDNSKTQYYDTYQLNGEIYETVYGDVNDRSLIVHDDEKLAADSELIGEPSAFNARHQQNTHKFNYAESYEKGMRFAKEKSISYADLANNPNLIKFPVHRGYDNVRRIVLSIYIEGWDLRSINSTMGSTFMSNLSFKIFREA